jgi:hypothetical protein
LPRGHSAYKSNLEFNFLLVGHIPFQRDVAIYQNIPMSQIVSRFFYCKNLAIL